MPTPPINLPPLTPTYHGGAPRKAGQLEVTADSAEDQYLQDRFFNAEPTAPGVFADFGHEERFSVKARELRCVGRQVLVTYSLEQA